MGVPNDSLRDAQFVEHFGLRVEQCGNRVDVAFVEVHGERHPPSAFVEQGAHFLVGRPDGCPRRFHAMGVPDDRRCPRRLHVRIGIGARVEEHLRDFEESQVCRCPECVALRTVGTFVEIGIRPGVEQTLDDADVVALGGG